MRVQWRQSIDIPAVFKVGDVSNQAGNARVFAIGFVDDANTKMKYRVTRKREDSGTNFPGVPCSEP